MERDIETLVELLSGRRVVALAGAGCSTESGIPDYRGPEGSLRRREPMQYREFTGSAAGRARYWARSVVGWSRFRGARPNAAHEALAALEAAGVVRGVITQNVDGLHQAAGSRAVVELHGSLASVRCLGCGDASTRDAFQARLVAENEGWWQRVRAAVAGGAVALAPDGDAELPEWAVSSFRVPGCAGCGGVVKPDVVFFGESVPKAWVDAAWRLYGEGEALLVVGSSLTVYSGRRFVYRAEKEGVPIAVVNLGPTRADELAALKVEGRVWEALPRLAAALAGRTAKVARQKSAAGPR